MGNPGTYGNANLIDGCGTACEFVNFSPSTFTYNLMLQANAPAIGAGTANGAAPFDILGYPRNTQQEDAGAYSYPK
jgi:hypothetical protein